MSELEDIRIIEEKRRIEHLKNAIPEKLFFKGEKKENLKIAYILRFTGINGGAKVLFEYSNKLSRRGHKVYLISHGDAPIWFPLDEKVEFIKVPDQDIVGEYIPKDVDLIVCGTNTCIYEAIEQRIAPVIYFEQGSHHLFNREFVEEEKLDFITNQYAICNNIYTVSEYTKEKINLYYNKDAYVIPNTVDKNNFYNDDSRKLNKKIVVSAMGPEEWDFKGIKYILDAIVELKKKYDIEFNWISPREPITKIENTYINPPQKMIGDILRKADIFISASEYESFCLPVLEAMTCGAAIVTTNAGGNMEFSIDQTTCLIINKRDSKDIFEKVERLILDRELRDKLSKNGLEISKNYDYDKSCDMVEDYYREIAMYSVEKY